MKKMAVFTSGGDSPGMNACIRSVVRTAISLGLEPYGIYQGYEGMIANEIQSLDAHFVGNIIQYGGTVLKTARSSEFMTKEGRAKAAGNLQALGIDALVCIGGDGSYTGARIFQEEFGIPVMGCPGTIDNDLFGTDYTIGFDSAVNTAVEAIDRIRDTADSHNRVFFVEVMGRHSGHIAISAALAGGAEGVFIPEKEGELEQVLYNYAQKRRKKAFSIFIVAEGDEDGKAYDIARVFQNKFPETDTRVSVLGHIQRGGNPTANDRILATRLGSAAVEALIQGRSGMACGIVNDKVTFTPFSDAISQSKGIQTDLWALNQLIS